MSKYEKPMTKVLIFGGKTGWIGGMMHDMCKEKGRFWLVIGKVVSHRIALAEAVQCSLVRACANPSSGVEWCIALGCPQFLSFSLFHWHQSCLGCQVRLHRDRRDWILLFYLFLF